MRNKYFVTTRPQREIKYEVEPAPTAIVNDWLPTEYYERGSLVHYRGALYWLVYSPTLTYTVLEEEEVLPKRRICNCSSVSRNNYKPYIHTCTSCKRTNTENTFEEYEPGRTKKLFKRSSFLPPDQDDAWVEIASSLPKENKVLVANLQDAFGEEFEAEVEVDND